MPQNDSIGLIRKLLPYSTAAVCLALLYLAWVFYSRRNDNAEFERRSEAKAAQQAKQTYEMYGAGQVKILLFYASPPVVRRGETTQLCYSIANATKVRIDHVAEPVWPSLSRCVPVKVKQSVTYTMTAEDDQGHLTEKTAEVAVQ